MKQIFFFVFIACALVLTSCDEKDIVDWSPDGKHIAVLAEDGVRVGSSDGQIPEKTNIDNNQVAIVRWMPNSIDALIVFKTSTSAWPEIRSLMSPAERLKTVSIAEKLWMTRKIESVDRSEALRFPQLITYLNHKYGHRGLISRLGKKAVPSPVTIWNVQLLDLANKIPTKRVLVWKSLEEIHNLQISPAGTLAAASVKTGLFYKIVALPLKGMKPLNDFTQPPLIVPSNSDIPSWSVDGKSLFYCSYPNVDPETPIAQMYDEEHPYIATLNCVGVADDHGFILSKIERPKKIVSVLAAHSSRVQCLPDGSTLFSGLHRSFPSNVNDDKLQESFFKLSSDLKSVTAIATQKLPVEKLSNFELNQDGSRVAISDKHGLVAVVDLTSGNVTELQAAGKSELYFNPKWRTKDQLCYLRVNRSLGEHSRDVVLQSMIDPDEVTVLSRGWSKDTFGFLVNPPVESESNANNKAQTKAAKTSAPRGKRKTHGAARSRAANRMNIRKE